LEEIKDVDGKIEWNQSQSQSLTDAVSNWFRIAMELWKVSPRVDLKVIPYTGLSLAPAVSLLLNTLRLFRKEYTSRCTCIIISSSIYGARE
jgi:hypothetical protein